MAQDPGGFGLGIRRTVVNQKRQRKKGTTRRRIGMKIKPLGDRILVKREEPSDTVKGGIIIPDTAKEKPQEGKVIAAGPGRLDDNGKRVPMEVKKGDRILMGKYAGTEVKIDGVEHIIMREEDVLAVIE
jgi:chaperonin GroES